MIGGEVFLSAFLQVLFDRLAPRELLQLALEEGVLSKLKKWERKLRMIQAVLSDAEERQLDSKNTAVNIWLDDLQDLAYDVEDILDEFATDALGRQLMAERSPSTSRVQNLFPAVKFKLRMRSKMKTITSRLEELCKIKDELGLKEITGSTATPNPRPPSASIPIEPAVYGRDDDKVKLIEMVFTAEPSEANFCVIPIVGMGGIGKTTLARKVYNDKAVEDNFNLKVWVCVSNDFDIIRISQTILQSITHCPCHLTDLNLIQIELQAHIRDKKFFLVFDDVWSEDYDLWESLRSPFMAGAPGSRIIVTTRNFDVASTITGSTKHHGLKPLSDEDCWSVFEKHAFENKDTGAFPHLESVRKKVIAKCKGLPLVAKTLGGLLRSKQRYDEWEDILNSEFWNLSYENDRILPVLRLSYYHLPSHLKRCFGYCAIFPKNFEFEETQLVFLWMAEGLIQQAEGNKQLEEIGGKYFRDLLSRSIFQQSSSDESKFVMHDLVNDLAQWVSQKTCFRLNDELRPEKQQRRFNMARHSSYTCSNYDGESKFAVFHDVKRLRTFLPMRYDDSTRYVTSMVLYALLPKFKRLRVLSFATYNIIKLPNSIGGLTHLRYLNLSQTKIKYLPESTSSLYNLQILILTDCCDLVKLPTKMRNLINLRHLDITGVNLITEMPVGMKELKYLQTLSNFIVKQGGSSLEDLKYLKFLREKLCISKLDNSQLTRSLILREKDGLKVLMLEWSSQFDNSRNVTVEKHVLEMLQPHENLEELTIKCYAGTTFPRWVGNPLLCSKMVVLRLESCKNCTSLPSLGLLRSLADLTIKGMTGIKRIGSEIYGEGCSESFHSLKNLCFEDLEGWENWDLVIENEHVKRFPCLQKLSIKNCPKLSGVPLSHLQSLEKLVILECQQLVVSFSSLQMLCELEIEGCKEMVCISLTDSKSLRSATLSNSSEFGTWLGQGQSILTSLKVLCIKNCNVLTSLPEGIKNCYHLEYLEIEGCDSLTSIMRDQLPLSLKRFSIINCKELQSLFDGREDSSSSAVITESLLEYLHISNCPTLKSLSLEAQSLAALKFLKIWNCAELRALSSRGQLPVALKHLQIQKCLELTTLSVSHQLPETLEYLQIDNCPELGLIAGRFHNNLSLHFIEISNCKKLESLPDGLHTLSRLQRIDINDCRSLVSFPQGGLPNSITSVSICRCEKLEVLPSSMHNLNFLHHLDIRRCPNIQSLPDEGFPTNLTSLSVEDQNICRSLVEWGLNKLTSLKHLSISGCSDEVSFPGEEMLPASLTKLTIQKFPKLKYLYSHGFQNLTSLEHLLIRECPNLMSLPEVGLLSSLLRLCIFGCPKLKKQCKRDKGKEWSKISHIPYIEIDHIFYA